MIKHSLFKAVILMIEITAITAPICPDFKVQNPSDGICKSIQIHNHVRHFQQLENCSVIEGYLRISVISTNSKDMQITNLSFPKLREITDYLMLYRVHGLKTLSKLFPNLAVIRGRVPFNNYALVIYEMQELQEIGLPSLQALHGGVRLTSNKKLCYIQTVDWKALGSDHQSISDNKEEDQCANFCPDKCAVGTQDGSLRKRCWDSNNCQKNLNCKGCTSCMANGTCCNKECLGGCYGTGDGNCVACKGYILKGKCFEKCPDNSNTYRYFKRRCLTDKECLGLRNNTRSGEGKAMILDGIKKEAGECVTQCPENYVPNDYENEHMAKCVMCKGPCPKVCNGSEVTSQEQAISLEGCSKIQGDLTIKMHSGSQVAEMLEKYLGNIREITGFLSIKNSKSLLTLHFLKKLEVIGGETLDDKSAFVVQYNDNLLELFRPERLKKMKINNGTIEISENAKLCFYKIEKFANQFPNIDSKSIDQLRNSNTEPYFCSKRQLNLTVNFVSSDNVVLEWEKDGVGDGNWRSILTYIIHYRELKSENETTVSIYKGRDACSDDVWMTKEVEPHAALEGSTDTKTKEKHFMKGVVPNLKPFTKYAVYVQVYKIKQSASQQATTKVIYFHTKPDYPTEPRELVVTSDVPNELIVEWKAPKNPHGIITHYKVIYKKQELDPLPYMRRDYCEERDIGKYIQSSQTTKKLDVVEEKPQDPNCCDCPKSKEDLEAESRMQHIENYFEDYLQAHVYCKRNDKLPNEMAMFVNGLVNNGPMDFNSDVGFTNVSEEEIEIETKQKNRSQVDDGNSTDEKIQEVIVYEQKAILANLEHFQEYNIEVQACQNTTTESNEKLCSMNRAITVGRTRKADEADNVNASSVKHEVAANSTGDVLITWQAPHKPNGFIIKYEIRYKRSTDEFWTNPTCISIKEYIKSSGYSGLKDLDPGNWTYQIRPWSLASNGSWTRPQTFMISAPPGEADASAVIIALTFIAVIIIILFITGVVWAIAKHRFSQNAPTVISHNPHYVPSDQLYNMGTWEVERDKVKLIKELGQGSFGMVYEGICTGLRPDEPDDETSVAVKTVNDRATFNDKREFLKEASIMKEFDCYHVVKLLGVVSTSQPALVIMELMAMGDLKNYLREHRPDENSDVSPPNLLDILQMAGEIADGMAYLAHKRVVHRDLAARNCMVAEDKTVKIGDFGMTRDIYETDYYRKGGKGMLPVRWMAPESLKDGVFTTSSDVWSYGVVMWEMVTLAAQPYQGLSNEQVVRYISEGNTMDIPEKCPQKMAQLMTNCWAKRPKDRPSFMRIIEFLLEHLSCAFEKVSYFFNDGGGPGGTDGRLPDPDPSEAGEDSDEEPPGATGGLSTSGATIGGTFKAAADHFATNSLYGDGSHEGFSDEGEDDPDRFYPPQLGINRLVYSEESDTHADSISFSGASRPPHDLYSDLHKLSRPPSFTVGVDHSSAGSSGLIELQPLISRDKNMNNPSLTSHKLSSSVQTPLPSLSSPGPRPSPLSPPSSLMDAPGPSVSPRGARWRGAPPAQPSPLQSGQPTLRLPTLNQPPGGHRARGAPPSSSSGAHSQNFNNDNKTNNNVDLDSQEDDPSCSLLGRGREPLVDGVTRMEEGQGAPTSRRPLGSPPLSPSHGYTDHEDSSKESSKSSGSHSLINGLTNGHIPLTSLRNRTSPC